MPSYRGISHIMFINKNEGKYLHCITINPLGYYNYHHHSYCIEEETGTQRLFKTEVKELWFELRQPDIKIHTDKHYFSFSIYIKKKFFCVCDLVTQVCNILKNCNTMIEIF